jgi:hypothetical protein
LGIQASRAPNEFHPVDGGSDGYSSCIRTEPDVPDKKPADIGQAQVADGENPHASTPSQSCGPRHLTGQRQAQANADVDPPV